MVEEREKAIEHVLKTGRDKDVKLISLWFTDILGFLKSFDITPRELETVLVNGAGFDGSSIEGFARIDESDMIALPRPFHLSNPALEPAAVSRSQDVLRYSETRRRTI